MSGIVGIVNLDGAPVDRSEIESLTAQLGRRGPDGDGVWVEGNVGLGHTLLHTTSEREHRSQPMSLDGQVWITADARVDGQAELARKLIASGRLGARQVAELRGAGDEALILHAYDAWGDACVEHLLGDFAFAIWDGRRRRLLCARDQLGVKPLFYAVARRLLLFSSELDCLRGHPSVTDELDDLAIADFLLFGRSQELDATAFASVRRLPPAHTLTWSSGRPNINRYWELSIPPEVQYAREQDYVERFDGLLRAAVGDRLRTDSVAVALSGGLDSATLAAVAKGELASRGGKFELRAHTISYEGLIPDEEPRFARIAADTLKIPLDLYRAGGDPLFAGWQEPVRATPEPSIDSAEKVGIEMMRGVAEDARVVLTGFDGDALCTVWLASHFRGLLRSLRSRRALADAWWLASTQRWLPPLGVRSKLRGPAQRRRTAARFPPWLAEDLVLRYGLRTRWQSVLAPRRSPDREVRADAVELISGGALTGAFDSWDPALTAQPVVARHPLSDLRVIEFLLSLPPIPWAVNKTILRRAARARSLPRSISDRPKSPLAGDPTEALVRRGGELANRRLRRSAALDRYLASEQLPSLAVLAGTELFWPARCAFSLEHWLRSHSLGT